MLLALFAAAARAAEPRVETMRDKLRAKILESLAPGPGRPPAETKPDDGTPVQMPPLIVIACFPGKPELQITRDAVKPLEPKFSAVGGGTLYRKDHGRVRTEMGGWWNPRQGWSFLRFSW